MKRSRSLVCMFAMLVALAPAAAFARVATLSLTVDHGVPLKLKDAASSVFIANPDIADVQVMSPTEVMVFGKRVGETTFMATDSKGTTLAERTVVVSQDLSGLRQELETALTGNQIKATAVPNGIVLTGTAKDPASVADAYKIAMRYMPPGGDIINRVQVVGSNQVMIRVRFAEVQRNINNSLGFNWQNLATLGGPFSIGLVTGSTFGTRPNNTSLGLSNDTLSASLNVSHLSIDGMIDALAQDGLLTILAEPSLTAMSGETANFLAGGQFPIPIPQGNGTISIQFQPYGISLAFTPTILNGSRISLHVRPEVSELTNTGAIILNNITVPALTTRKAETTVEVASGQSFAIAGLMDNSQTQTVNKFPLLGDLPILGPLFRDSNFQNGQTELVVIITPYIVTPSRTALSLPTDGLAPPSESERLAGMRYSSGDPNARPQSGDPVGIMLPSAAPASAPVLQAPAPAAAPVAPVSETPAAPPAPVLAPAAPEPAPADKTAAPVETPAPPPAPVPAPEEKEKPAPVPAPEPVSSNDALPAATVDGTRTASSALAAPAVTAPPAPPLVLHSSHDADKSSGGLLVE